MAEDTTRTRTGFAPVVVLGLAAAGLAAVAGNKPWAVTRARADFVPGGALQQTADRFPLAGAVALLLLATWGVVLVTRRWIRRGVTVLGVVEALGLLACVVLGPPVVREQVTTSGATTAHLSGWYWTFLAAALLALVTDRARRPSGAALARDGHPLRRARRPHPDRGRRRRRREQPRPLEGDRRGARSHSLMFI